MSRRPVPRPARRRGMALVITLVVVMLITFFISEFTFKTGLELRSLQTYKEVFQARTLARTVFKAVESGMLFDEAVFMDYYGRLRKVLELTPIPWEEGLLVDLQVQPLDPLFNLNRFSKQRAGEDNDALFWNLFKNTLADVVAKPAEYNLYPTTLDENALAELYAALFDWIDGDERVYDGRAPATGAEAADYFGKEPEFRIRDGKLDRLSEIRLVRGVAESGIRWADWERRFTVRERSEGRNNLYPGLINPNVATREEIASFLVARSLDEATTESLGGDSPVKQDALNTYADRAEAIATILVPEESSRPRHDMASIKEALQQANVNPNYATQVFTPAYQYYRIRLVTEVAQVQARLEAVVKTNRDATTRMASQVKLLEYSLQ